MPDLLRDFQGEEHAGVAYRQDDVIARTRQPRLFDRNRAVVLFFNAADDVPKTKARVAGDYTDLTIPGPAPPLLEHQLLHTGRPEQPTPKGRRGEALGRTAAAPRAIQAAPRVRGPVAVFA